MRKDAIFINEERFRELSPLVGSLDYDYILPFLQVAQDKLIQQALGQPLFQRLKDLINNEKYKFDINLEVDRYEDVDYKTNDTIVFKHIPGSSARSTRVTLNLSNPEFDKELTKRKVVIRFAVNAIIPDNVVEIDGYNVLTGDTPIELTNVFGVRTDGDTCFEWSNQTYCEGKVSTAHESDNFNNDFKRLVTEPLQPLILSTYPGTLGGYWPHLNFGQSKINVPYAYWTEYTEGDMLGPHYEFLDDNHKELIDDFICKTLVWEAVKQALEFLSVKISNSGLIQKSTDEDISIAMQDIIYLKSVANDNAEFYNQRLINFLQANSNNFPYYTKETNGEIKASTDNYSGGLSILDEFDTPVQGSSKPEEPDTPPPPVIDEYVKSINGQSGELIFNILTDTEREKLTKIIINGLGDAFLANDGNYKKITSSTVETTNPLIESITQAGVTQNLINQENRAALFAIRDVISRLAGAAVTIDADPKDQPLNTTETDFTFVEEIPTTNPDIIVVDETANTVTLKEPGVYQWASTHTITNSSNFDRTVTVRTREGNTALTERYILVEKKSVSIATTVVPYELLSGDAPQTLRITFECDEDNDCVLNDFQTSLTTSAGNSGPGGGTLQDAYDLGETIDVAGKFLDIVTTNESAAKALQKWTGFAGVTMEVMNKGINLEGSLSSTRLVANMLRLAIEDGIEFDNFINEVGYKLRVGKDGSLVALEDSAFVTIAESVETTGTRTPNSNWQIASNVLNIPSAEDITTGYIRVSFNLYNLGLSPADIELRITDGSGNQWGSSWFAKSHGANNGKYSRNITIKASEPILKSKTYRIEYRCATTIHSRIQGLAGTPFVFGVYKFVDNSGGTTPPTTNEPVTASLKFDKDYIATTANRLVMTDDITLSLEGTHTPQVGKVNFFEIECNGTNAINLSNDFKPNAIQPSDLNGKVLDARTYQFVTMYFPDGIGINAMQVSQGAVIPQLGTPTLNTPTMGATTANLEVSVNIANNSGYQFEYKETSSGTWLDGGTSAQDVLTNQVSGLTLGVQYDFRVKAIGDGSSYTDSNYSDIVQGTTSSNIVAPTVTTQAVTSITATTATGNGNITDLGGENATAHGIVYNTTGTPTLSDTVVDNGSASNTGAFTANMTGLTDGQTYYVRAFATNSQGTSYGGEVNFVAETVVIPSALAVWDVDASSFIDNGTTGATDNDAVQQISDPNGGFHFRQETASDKPTYKANSLNGFATVELDGNFNHMLAISPLGISTSSVTMISVSKATLQMTTSNHSVIANRLENGGTLVTNRLQSIIDTRNITDVPYALTSDSTPTSYIPKRPTAVPVNQWVVKCDVYNRGISLTSYEDAVLGDSVAIPTITLNDEWQLGGSTSIGNRLQGNIAYVAIYNVALTEAQAIAESQRLMTKYGL